MKGLIVPILLALIGTGGGIGAGLFLKPSSDMAEAEDMVDEQAEEDMDGEDGEASGATEFARLNNQFVVPILEDGEVRSLIVMSLQVEVDAGRQDLVFSKEPRIRDEFLQLLFDHSNMGGFAGNFTDAHNMDLLRSSLRRAAKQIVGPEVHDVLIVEIVRQDF